MSRFCSPVTGMVIYFQGLSGGTITFGFGEILLRAGLVPFHFDGTSIVMLIYLSILSSAGFLLWNFLMKFNSVGSVSMYLALIPLFGVMLSALVLNERLHLSSFLSLFLIILGIIIVNRRSGVKEKETAAPR